MTIQKKQMAGFVTACLITGMCLSGTTGFASTTDNPIPPQVVLNQTVTNGVPMVSATDSKWPSISSHAAVVMDMSTGTIVFAKNPNQEHYPASITKIMTAMLALQHGQLDDQLVASSAACDQEPDKLYLVPGETEPLHNLLYGLLLISANDAAVDIAEHYGGSVQGFADMMNEEAAALGAKHTHFVNPNGLPNPQHVTTSYDMALIARAAMQYSVFRDIVSTKRYHWQGDKWQSELTNLNKMLYYYPGAIGIKTGFTSVAHNTLVVAATRNQQTFLAVLMDAQSNYEIRHDASQLLNHAFADYQTQNYVTRGTVVGQTAPVNGEKINVVAGSDLVATTRAGQALDVRWQLKMEPITRNIPANGKVGSLEVLEDGKLVASVPAVVQRPVVLHDASADGPSWLLSATWWGTGGLGVVASGFLVMRLYRRRRVSL